MNFFFANAANIADVMNTTADECHDKIQEICTALTDPERTPYTRRAAMDWNTSDMIDATVVGDVSRYVEREITSLLEKRIVGSTDTDIVTTLRDLLTRQMFNTIHNMNLSNDMPSRRGAMVEIKTLASIIDGMRPLIDN